MYYYEYYFSDERCQVKMKNRGKVILDLTLATRSLRSFDTHRRTQTQSICQTGKWSDSTFTRYVGGQNVHICACNPIERMVSLLLIGDGVFEIRAK